LTGGRLSYLCPLPWHNETKPSFVVWTNQEYENFYCFGCQSKHNIIHLVSHLDSVTAKQAIEQLAEGMEFSYADEEKLELEACIKAINLIGIPKKSKNPVAEVSKTLIELSDMCRWFLVGAGHDPKECERIDAVWTMVDSSLRDFDLPKIEQIRKEIGPMLREQRSVLRRRHIEGVKKQYE